jgi:Zn-dependent protease
LAIRVGLATGLFDSPPVGLHGWSMLVVPADALADSEVAAFATRALSVMLSLNVILAVFNLIPLPPLDGSAVIDIALPERYAGFMRRLGFAGSMLGLLIAWKVMPRLVGPIYTFLERVVQR